MPSSTHFSVRDNYITLHCSDPGPSVGWDAEQSHVVRDDGSVDYMHHCTGDDPTLIDWKTKIGTFLAQEVLELPGASGRTYMLSSLPRGYQLLVHKKGDRFNPRTDAYLRGSKTVNVFRSPAEFFFHAKWLLLGCPKPDPFAPEDPDEELFGTPPPEELWDRCGCKYCHGTNQTYISKNFSKYVPQRRRPQKHKMRKEEKKEKFTARFEGVPL